MPFLLEPAALIWRAVTWLRWRTVTPYRSRLPVICIGNLTVGGTGKTPAAIAIAEMLKKEGEKPVFLTRGHGGSIPGPHKIDPANETAAQVGDEALLLAETAPVVVARDRAEGAKLCEATSASVIVMDDGFQNPSLEKDISLLTIDRSLGTGNGLIVPAGPLRAPVSRQLAHAQAAVLVGEGAAADDIAARMQAAGKPVYYAHVRPAGDIGWLAGKPVVAFAGIGHPEKFFRALEQAGARLVERAGFPDHHDFSERNATRLLASAEREKALLVTTGKDLMRLAGKDGIFKTLKEKTRALPVRLEFQEREIVSKFLLDGLPKRRSG